MYYSLTFKINNVERNTWNHWKLIPNTPPMISAPEPNTNYVEIPGRSGGPIDLTGTPFNKLTYKRMTGSWTFLREPDERHIRKELYEFLLNYFNGKAGRVILEEDPVWYYVGRFKVGLPTTSVGPIKITISYDLSPVRYSVYTDEADPNYGDADVTPYHEGVIPGPGQQLDLEYDSSTSDLKIIGF